MMFSQSVSKQFLHLAAYLIVIVSATTAQPLKKAEKKYPSILWEITGKGASKPSYLMGTMHVSNKMVFNLGDSFYHAIEHTDYVGLELDPGYWQEYFSKNNRSNMGGSNLFASLYRRFQPGGGGGSLTKSMFAIEPYEKDIENALTMEPTIINSLLYRKSQEGQEYEEDTYLDMYLYQICKKLDKKIVGLEIMETSERMSKQAMLALEEGRGKATRNTDDDDRSTMTIEDAYKTGDLDMLDSIERREMPVQKFRTIFIDDRNAIQAASIDSVIRLGKTIFAGVGAAHLPGMNGVIEVLRKKGYKLRPVKLNNRNSLEKDRIDKIHYPVQFATHYTADSVIKAEIPGNWYRFRTGANLLQYSDLANGSYYILTRVPTDALFQGGTQADVLRKVDSMLYENIPGKILSKTAITNSGYSGFDISNRTRRGDRQRYQIFVTPFEVVIAKMSGSSEYVATGTEATTFFNSIRIKPLEKTAAVNFEPSWGAFSVRLPHQPYIINRIAGNSLKPYCYEATDAAKGIDYSIIKATRQRTGYLEEDTFELNLLSESYASSKMVEKETGKKFLQLNGYPAMDATYKLKDNRYSTVRYVIQGPHYYAIIAQQKAKPFAATPDALASFRIQPFEYGTTTLQTDSIFGFTFQSPVKMNTDDNSAEDIAMIAAAMPEKMSALTDLFRSFFAQSLTNDSTGESIQMSGVKFPAYTYIADSSRLQNLFAVNSDSDFVVRKSAAAMQNGWQIKESWYSDTNSSRMLHTKSFYRQGVVAGLTYYTDTLTGESSFAKAVFNSFSPADSIKSSNPFTAKGPLFFEQFTSTDSTTKAKAINSLSSVVFTKKDLPLLKNTMTGLKWDGANYLSIKKRFLEALGNIPDKDATEYLKELYAQANDTAMYQQQILYSLLNQRTTASFKAFEELITSNPPVELGSSYRNRDDVDEMPDMSEMLMKMLARNGNDLCDEDLPGSGRSRNWGQLTDTMQLTQKILPGLLNLMSLDDYQRRMESLVNDMADSGYVQASDLQSFYTKFLLEAKQEYKKALADESETAMKKKAAALKKKDGDEVDDNNSNSYYGERYGKRYGNRNSGHSNLYDKLVTLTPFYDKQQSVRDLFQQAFTLKDDEHLYKLTKLLIRKGINAYPDTLINHFAADLDYRSRLYEFLYDQQNLKLFPTAYSTPLALAQSRFRSANLSATDTMAYIAKKPFTLRQTSGDIYFFKYKAKKAENWKWGMVEMVPSQEMKGQWDMTYTRLDDATSKKLDVEKTPDEQMTTLLKEKLAGSHPSAYQFYNDDDNYGRYGYDMVALAEED